jgi:putative tricarboxylic transport membrane protein
MLCVVPAAMAQQYPNKPLQLIVGGPAGGGLDQLSRAFEQALREAKTVEQPLVIVNMGGGAGNAAKAFVHQHRGDPYYLYLDTNRVYLNKLLGTTALGHDAVTPLGRLIAEYMVWAVRADSPFKSAREILDRLKVDPGSVVFGLSSLPSNDQINVVAPAIAAGVDAKKMRMVAFNAAGGVNTQLLGGHVPVISTTLSEIVALVRSGQVRLLAVSSPERLGGEMASVPHWRSIGIDVAVVHWRGLFAPPDLPPEALKYWEERLARFVKTEAWKKALEKYGWSDAHLGAAAFKKEMDREAVLFAKILTDLGMVKSAPQ